MFIYVSIPKELVLVVVDDPVGRVVETVSTVVPPFRDLRRGITVSELGTAYVCKCFTHSENGEESLLRQKWHHICGYIHQLIPQVVWVRIGG